MFQSEELTEILKAELARGNEIAETSAWPTKCKTLIILKRRFHKPYEVKNLEYRKINDPHYWHAEYATKSGEECLACK